MHETVIAKKIIEDAKKNGKVTKAIIEVGELAHVPLKDLEPTLRSLADFELELKEVKAECKCACGYEGPPNILERGHDSCIYLCPKCEGVPEITVGSDIILKEITVE